MSNSVFPVPIIQSSILTFHSSITVLVQYILSNRQHRYINNSHFSIIRHYIRSYDKRKALINVKVSNELR